MILRATFSLSRSTVNSQFSLQMRQMRDKVILDMLFILRMIMSGVTMILTKTRATTLHARLLPLRTP